MCNTTGGWPWCGWNVCACGTGSIGQTRLVATHGEARALAGRRGQEELSEAERRGIMDHGSYSRQQAAGSRV